MIESNTLTCTVSRYLILHLQDVGKVTTAGEPERALTTASAEDDKFFLIDICLPDRGCSAGLKQLADTFRQIVSVKQP